MIATPPPPSPLGLVDLHLWNILVTRSHQPTKRLEARFHDWGDAVLAHAFASLLVPLGQLRQRLQVPADDARILRLRDAYLAPFSELASHAELVEAVELACHAAKAARALTWARALGTLNPAEVREYAGMPLRWLGHLLDESYLGKGG